MKITLGLEEELQVVDADSLDLIAHDVEAGRRAIPDALGTSCGETHQCVLEVQTPVCQTVDTLVKSLASMRAVAAARAQLQGQRVLAAGLHPFADWRNQLVQIDHPHYARLIADYGDGARGALAFGLHIHFGLPSPATRLEVLNRLRERLPSVLALSASAPYSQGRDTGFQTWRPSMLDRLPRMGIPQEWVSEAEYFDYLKRLRGVGVIGPDQGIWADLRLHHHYGTVEVRVCDACPSLDRVWLIAALLLSEVHTLDGEVRRGCAKPILPAALIAENRWMARRHGIAAGFVDWHRDELVAGPEHYARWLDRLEPAAHALGLLYGIVPRLDAALSSGTSAGQQRAVVSQGGSLRDVVQHLIAETARPLADVRKGSAV